MVAALVLLLRVGGILYEAGYRETNARGGSTSLVAQFLQEMRDPGSE